MAKFNFVALPTDAVRALQSGGRDANGQVPESGISDGIGNPCRHCLRDIPAGEKKLVLAYRPFPSAQPYAELGPIFLCAEFCERHPQTAELPDMFMSREKMLLRAYDASDRIIYGSGRLAAPQDLPEMAGELLEQDGASYLHMRSASYNCYQCRIEKA
ncbi:MAG: DUF1203 domain-containing protein [Gammaproteobacteria bacterium]